MTITLTVTAKGQITLGKEALEHLGVQPGGKVDVDLLRGGRMRLRASRGKPIETIFGLLAKPGTRPRSIEELNEATAAGWAGDVKFDGPSPGFGPPARTPPIRRN